MTQCRNFICHIGIAAGTSVGGVTCFGTGGGCHSCVIVVTGSRNFLIGGIVASRAVLVCFVTCLGTGGGLGCNLSQGVAQGIALGFFTLCTGFRYSTGSIRPIVLTCRFTLFTFSCVPHSVGRTVIVGPRTRSQISAIRMFQLGRGDGDFVIANALDKLVSNGLSASLGFDHAGAFAVDIGTACGGVDITSGGINGAIYQNFSIL